MLALLLFIALFGSVRDGPPPVLQPKTYTSPSGEWELFVDPTQRLGGGPGRYRVSQRGKVAWQGERPFTFWDAAVDDRGYSAGYAYTAGQRDYRVEGQFVVAIFAPDGGSLLYESIARKASGQMHTGPDPFGGGVALHPDLDQCTVRVLAHGGQQVEEDWWRYETSTGLELERVRPKALLEDGDFVGRCAVARPVHGTPLTLVQWTRYQWSQGSEREDGTRFVLCDAECKPVWMLALDHDYDGVDRSLRSELYELQWAGALVPPARAPRQFELVHYADKTCVTYEVEPADEARTAWNVREVGRKPFAPPVEVPVPALPKIDLRKLASVPLGGGVSKTLGPIRDIVAFTLTPTGGIQFVRRERENEYALVTVDEHGELIVEKRVAPIEALGEGKFAWWPLGESRWLATHSSYGRDAKARAWSLDGESGQVDALESFDCYAVDALESTGDGGFVALATHRTEYQAPKVLARFDAQGVRLWEREQSVGYDRDDPAGFLSPDDIAITREGTIVVLDNIRNSLQTFRGDGEFVALLELEKAWGQEPRYPTDVFVEADGKLLIHDFNASPSWWRMSIDGEVSARFDLSRDDGSKEFGYSGTMRVAADGALWNTDGRVFMRFDAARTGRMDRELGRAADAHELQEASNVFIDGLGRIAIEEGRTHALHFFDASGAATFVCVPDDKQVDATKAVHAQADGGVLVDRLRSKGTLLAFDARGRPTAPQAFAVELASMPPDFAGAWGTLDKGFDVLEVRRVSPLGEVLGQISRRPNGEWFQSVADVAVNREGAVAVLNGHELALYSADGAPTRAIDMGNLWFNYVAPISHGTRRITVATREPGAVLISQRDGSVRQFVTTEVPREHRWTIALSPDQSELWLATTHPPTLHRYALPE